MVLENNTFFFSFLSGSQVWKGKIDCSQEKRGLIQKNLLEQLICRRNHSKKKPTTIQREYTKTGGTKNRNGQDWFPQTSESSHDLSKRTRRLYILERIWKKKQNINLLAIRQNTIISFLLFSSIDLNIVWLCKLSIPRILSHKNHCWPFNLLEQCVNCLRFPFRPSNTTTLPWYSQRLVNSTPILCYLSNSRKSSQFNISRSKGKLIIPFPSFPSFCFFKLKNS